MINNKIISLILAVVMTITCVIPMGAVGAASAGDTLTAVLPDLSVNPSADPTEVTVSGTSVQYPGTVVTIMVYLPLSDADKANAADIRSQVTFAEELILDDDSSFSTTFNISGNAGAAAPSGRYTVCAYIPGMSNPMTAYFDYKDVGAANAVVTAVNTATTVSEIKTALDNGISAVDVASGVSYYSYKDEKQRTAAAQYVFSLFNQGGTATEGEIKVALTDITSSLDAIADLTDDTRDDMKSNLKKYMAASYANLMGFTDADINTYNNVLTDDQRDKAVVYMAGNAKDLLLPTELTTLFGKALTEAVKDDVEYDYSSSSGGGVGRGSVSVGSAVMPQAPTENSSAGLDAFGDIGSVAWAKNAINILSAKGVVSGRSESEFAPNDPILREELVKLLIQGFGIISSTGKLLPFDDVSPTAWYYEYVVRAYTLGITSGISAEAFGVGRAVTRQDMAVLMYNALNCAGFSPEPNTEEFTFADDENIADYAKEAVYTLAKAGIINGMGDGTFAPGNSATRAEVAVLLYRTMHKFNLI